MKNKQTVNFLVQFKEVFLQYGFGYIYYMEDSNGTYLNLTQDLKTKNYNTNCQRKLHTKHLFTKTMLKS